jgi:hypothetical protein
MVVCAWLSAENPTILQRRHLLEPICQEGRLPGLGTEFDYRRWFAESGFVLESFEDISSQVSKTWSVCGLRLLSKLLRHSRYVRFLLGGSGNGIFAVTIGRIRLAYALGVMRYGIFHRPQGMTVQPRPGLFPSRILRRSISMATRHTSSLKSWVAENRCTSSMTLRQSSGTGRSVRLQTALESL